MARPRAVFSVQRATTAERRRFWAEPGWFVPANRRASGAAFQF
jgi:hypothetical protein